MRLSINCHLAASRTSLGYNFFYIAQQVTCRFVVSKHAWLLCLLLTSGKTWVCCFKDTMLIFFLCLSLPFFLKGEEKSNCFPPYVSQWFCFFTGLQIWWCCSFLVSYIGLWDCFKEICTLQTFLPSFWMKYFHQ